MRKDAGEDETLVPRKGHWGDGERTGAGMAGAWVLRRGIAPTVPHVVVLPEERVVLHSPLLQLHVQAAPVDGHHLADAAGPQGGV